MAGVPGFEPGYDGIKTRCLTAWRYPNWNILIKMAGVPGFEPGYGGIRIHCLTAWRHPKNGGYDGIRTCDPRIMSAML